MVTPPPSLLRPGFKSSTLIVFNVSNVQIYTPISCEGCPSGTSPSQPLHTHVSTSLQLHFNVYIIPPMMKRCSIGSSPISMQLQDTPTPTSVQTTFDDAVLSLYACKLIAMSEYIYTARNFSIYTLAWADAPSRYYTRQNLSRALVPSTRCLVRGQLGNQ